MKTLAAFTELWQKMTATSARLEKEAILAAYRDDDAIKTVLQFLFDPFVVTGISKRKLQKKVDLTKAVACDSLLALLAYFREHNTGRDEDLAVLQRFVADLAPTQRDIVYGLIKKDLTLGANEKTLNKVFGAQFIPSFEVMLAERYAENMDYVVGKRFILTEKLDGVRCLLLFNAAGVPTFFSRSGKAHEDLVEIAAEAEKLNHQIVYDGELLLDRAGRNMDSAELYRLTVKVTAKDGEKRGLIFNVFDRLPKEDLLRGKSDIPCEQRKKDLAAELQTLALPHIKNVETQYIGADIEKIDTICDEFTQKGCEGIMVNLAAAPYECKRTKNLLKVKRFNTADVRVLSWEEGEGANKGKLGAVIIEFTAPDGHNYTCKVGSGFHQDDRIYFFQHPEEIVGHIIEIGYFELSQNQNDAGYSLRFPTYKGLRNDKNEISMY